METYSTIQGDTWDIIAKKFYDDEKYAGFLMANNWPLLEYMVFPSGIEVSIPELTEEDKTELPIWRD